MGLPVVYKLNIYLKNRCKFIYCRDMYLSCIGEAMPCWGCVVGQREIGGVTSSSSDCSSRSSSSLTMLALAHPPIQRDRNCNQIVQRVSSSTSTHQLKRSKSSNKPSSRTSPIQTHHPIPPRDPPEPVQPKPAPAPTPSTAPAAPLPHLPLDPYQPFDINALPATELLPLLASLLQEIALANNHLHNLPENAFCPPSGSSEHLPRWNSLTSAARAALETPCATRSFHADRPPQISLEAYLLRILKYCPTSNEVFLSLLVYFDRMSRLSTQATGRDFVIDSYNIHRLVIAGVTVASKFFSDVFYTNSRYAKVRSSQSSWGHF
jgi:hypothetical protein